MSPNYQSIIIFDLDGTLTDQYSTLVGDKTKTNAETYSFWRWITGRLVQDKILFDQAATAWKKTITKDPLIDKIQSSKEMMELGLRMMRSECCNAMVIFESAVAITQEFLKCGVVRKDAIEYLKNCLELNITCVISTASYEEGARGFVQGLVGTGLLRADLAAKILVSGTNINWDKLEVIHMNVDTNKLHGLETALDLSLAEIKPKIKAIFADDPLINDRALLNGLCTNSFVIRTEKNNHLTLPPGCVFITWQEVLKNKP